MKFHINKRKLLTLFTTMNCFIMASFSASASLEIASANLSPAILNGVDTSLSLVPYQVRLTITKNNGSQSKYYLCGGSIIDNTVVLTAAHCLEDEGTYSTTSVTVYYLDYSDSSNPTLQTATASSSQFSVNSNWTGSLDDSHDTAVIYLSTADFANAKKIKVADSSNMTSMYQEFSNTYVANQDNETNVMASGYGKDEDGVSGTLQRVLLTGIPTSTCSSLASNNVSGNDIVCVQSPTTSTNYGICSGDSGGPLVWQDPDHASDADYGIRLVGIASYVTTDSGSCRLNGQYYYGGYSSIYYFASEINSAIDTLMGGSGGYDITSTGLTYSFTSNPMDFTNTSSDADDDSDTEEESSSGGGGGGSTNTILLFVMGLVWALRRRCLFPNRL
ncbi:trypsin-like serine protease [Vibrio sp. CAIM 722]|uniref:Trypsin-like serine protease n=1 Tax=Vibrio eleionomae TaxID=2653505 RepID=A0A7X4LPD6_9VIBR|nr:trypsin-like serine protease [Vibrio eleionomae]MZI95718.1 trypsin-like serine protease [Vibrio eleionomae]